MDEVSKAIHHAAGILDAASLADHYARRWLDGNATCHVRVVGQFD